MMLGRHLYYNSKKCIKTSEAPILEILWYSVLARPFLSGAAPLSLSNAPLPCAWSLIMHHLVVIDNWLFKVNQRAEKTTVYSKQLTCNYKVR